MPDNIRLSMANMIALIVYAILTGIAFGSIQIGQHSLSGRVTIVELDVKDNRNKIHEAEVQRKEDRVRDEYMSQAMNRIESWIKEIERTKITE